MTQAEFPNELKEATAITKGNISHLPRLLNLKEKFKYNKHLSPMDEDLNFVPYTIIH